MVTTEEIERMLKDAAEELLKSKPTELKRLGIDEIALIKGKGNYCAVLIDLEKSKLIGIMPARTQEEISQVLRGWGKEVKRVNRRSKYRLVERLQKFSNGTKAECSSSC